MKIGIISDTHIPRRAKAIPEIVLETFRDADHIIHAGDLMSGDVIAELEKIAPVTAVAGNNDGPVLHKTVGDKKIVTLGKFRFGIVHGHGRGGKTLDIAMKAFQEEEVDCIIFGHSHTAYSQFHDGILVFNPGSPTDKRRNRYYSFGMIEIGEGISPRHIYFNKEGIIKEES